ncbi:hypothetical protein BV20DRAFT_216769 [Pilatotrama ljubarskyi]|nr:hypothetical protein BV20DRAFT_216769 [Pilatotrama ljubarskyi]
MSSVLSFVRERGGACVSKCRSQDVSRFDGTDAVSRIEESRTERGYWRAGPGPEGGERRAGRGGAGVGEGRDKDGPGAKSRWGHGPPRPGTDREQRLSRVRIDRRTLAQGAGDTVCSGNQGEGDGAEGDVVTPTGGPTRTRRATVGVAVGDGVALEEEGWSPDATRTRTGRFRGETIERGRRRRGARVQCCPLLGGASP